MATIYKTTNIKLATIDYENYLSVLAKWLKQNTINFAYRQKVKLPDFVMGDGTKSKWLKVHDDDTMHTYICLINDFIVFTLYADNGAGWFEPTVTICIHDLEGDVCTYCYKGSQAIKKYIKNTCYTGKYVQFTL